MSELPKAAARPMKSSYLNLPGSETFPGLPPGGRVKEHCNMENPPGEGRLTRWVQESARTAQDGIPRPRSPSPWSPRPTLLVLAAEDQQPQGRGIRPQKPPLNGRDASRTPLSYWGPRMASQEHSVQATTALTDTCARTRAPAYSQSRTALPLPDTCQDSPDSSNPLAMWPGDARWVARTAASRRRDKGMPCQHLRYCRRHHLPENKNTCITRTVRMEHALSKRLYYVHWRFSNTAFLNIQPS